MQRLSDRFKMEATATVKVDDEIYTFDVYDVSEHGVCLLSTFPYYISEKNSHQMTLTRDEYTVQFDSRITSCGFIT